MSKSNGRTAVRSNGRAAVRLFGRTPDGRSAVRPNSRTAVQAFSRTAEWPNSRSAFGGTALSKSNLSGHDVRNIFVRQLLQNRRLPGIVQPKNQDPCLLLVFLQLLQDAQEAHDQRKRTDGTGRQNWVWKGCDTRGGSTLQDGPTATKWLGIGIGIGIEPKWLRKDV